jgi:enoyl-CoA hydratase/carnithine racemase
MQDRFFFIFAVFFDGVKILIVDGVLAVHANEILMLGKTLTGEEAMEVGLVNRLVPKEKVKEEAMDLARQVAQNHPVAIRSMIRSLRLGKDSGLADALYLDAHAKAMCYNHQDWGEGLRAVAEKQAAEFDDYHSK